jgi:hypothetical protein
MLSNVELNSVDPFNVISCHFKYLCRVLTDVANELRDRGSLDEEECFIDATFVMAGRKHRLFGVLPELICYRHGHPLAPQHPNTSMCFLAGAVWSKLLT